MNTYYTVIKYKYTASACIMRLNNFEFLKRKVLGIPIEIKRCACSDLITEVHRTYHTRRQDRIYIYSQVELVNFSKYWLLHWINTHCVDGDTIMGALDIPCVDKSTVTTIAYNKIIIPPYTAVYPSYKFLQNLLEKSKI